MNVRPAGAADLPEIIAIERNTLSAAHWSESQYADVFSDGSQRVCLVVAGERGLHGFLIANRLGSEWELENIAVTEVSRQRGVGSELMSAFIAEARSKCAETIFLEVRESNTAARRLYEKCGFVETGRRKAYYSDPPEDAILYTRDVVGA